MRTVVHRHHRPPATPANRRSTRHHDRSSQRCRTASDSSSLRPFELIRTSWWTGKAIWQIIVCARSALRHESNDIAFQEQFRADPATSHGMLVAGCLRAKVYAAAVPRGATSIPADAESRTNSAPTGRRRNQSCPDRSAGMSWHRSRAAGEERSKD